MSSGRLVARVNNTDPEPIHQFAKIVRYGEIYGPYRYASRDGFTRKPFRVWLASEHDALEASKADQPE